MGDSSDFMKILSWNVRGLGDPWKQKRVKEIILEANPNIVMLQETKLESFGELYLRDV